VDGYDPRQNGNTEPLDRCVPSRQIHLAVEVDEPTESLDGLAEQNVSEIDGTEDQIQGECHGDESRDLATSLQRTTVVVVGL
jgi:hypothetical protein